VAGVPAERIYHLALRRDWEAAQREGEYRVSTLGRTLEQEGFLHASFGHQWQGVRAAFYAEVEEPLVLLEIDPALVDAPVVVEVPGDSAEAFPHIYGPLALPAVVAVTDLR
jgi:glutathione S-transferase